MAGALHSVLVIEDEADIRDSMQQILDGAGYLAMTASNGAEALALLARGPRPSLILLDLFMPGMNGWDFLDGLVAAGFGAIPVIIVSAVADLQAVPAGVEFIRKPFDVNHLLARVAAVCAAQSRP